MNTPCTVVKVGFAWVESPCNRFVFRGVADWLILIKS